jgi:hypothetical protein
MARLRLREVVWSRTSGVNTRFEDYGKLPVNSTMRAEHTNSR